MELVAPNEWIDIVESPDDGGVYLEWFNRATGAEKASVIYPDRAAAVDAMRRNAVEWEVNDGGN